MDRRRSLFASLPPVTLNLLLANVVVFLACVMLPVGEWIFRYGSLYWVQNPDFHLYQLFTYMFLHANFSHLFVNMFGLWMFGSTLERELGSQRYLLYYMVCGVGAALFQLGVNWVELSTVQPDTLEGMRRYMSIMNAPMVGASGAVMGVVMAFGVMHPNATIMLLIPPIPLKAKWFVLIYLALELFMGVRGAGSGIAHFAHVGGMLWGWLLLRWWKSRRRIFY